MEPKIQAYVSEDAAALASEKLERVWVFLLRHNTRAGTISLHALDDDYDQSQQLTHLLRMNTHLYASLSVTNPNSAVE